MLVADFIKLLEERTAPPEYRYRGIDELVMVDPDSGSLCFVGGIVWNEPTMQFIIVAGDAA